MHLLKVNNKIIPKPKNSFTKERKVPVLILSGNWLTTELGVSSGDKVLVTGHPTNPNALIVEKVLL